MGNWPGHWDAGLTMPERGHDLRCVENDEYPRKPAPVKKNQELGVN